MKDPKEIMGELAKMAEMVDDQAAAQFGERKEFLLLVFEGYLCHHMTNAGMAEVVAGVMRWIAMLPEEVLEQATALNGYDWQTETFMTGDPS